MEEYHELRIRAGKSSYVCFFWPKRPVLIMGKPLLTVEGNPWEA
jgi:hypothetical protein